MPNKTSEEYARGLLSLDRAADETNGVFTEPFPEDGPMYNIRALDKYCKNKGKDPSELTDEELKQFIVE